MSDEAGIHTAVQSGDGPDISLVEATKPPTELRDRWKVVEKMAMIPQYAFAGDYTGIYIVSSHMPRFRDSLV